MYFKAKHTHSLDRIHIFLLHQCTLTKKQNGLKGYFLFLVDELNELKSELNETLVSDRKRKLRDVHRYRIHLFRPLEGSDGVFFSDVYRDVG